MAHVTRGFRGRRADPGATALPAGQYLTNGFPVMSTGPTPPVSLEEWRLTVSGRKSSP